LVECVINIAEVVRRVPLSNHFFALIEVVLQVDISFVLFGKHFLFKLFGQVWCQAHFDFQLNVVCDLVALDNLSVHLRYILRNRTIYGLLQVELILGVL